jgi:hypothetical protein
MMTLGINVNAQTVAFDPIGLNMYRGSFDSEKKRDQGEGRGKEGKAKRKSLFTDVLSRHHCG